MQEFLQLHSAQILAILGTILGGLALSAATRLLDKGKQDRDEARSIREELRKDKDDLRQELNDLKAEVKMFEQMIEAKDIEIHRMRLDNVTMMEKFMALNRLYYDATGAHFEEVLLETPSGRTVLNKIPGLKTKDAE